MTTPKKVFLNMLFLCVEWIYNRLLLHIATSDNYCLVVIVHIVMLQQ